MSEEDLTVVNDFCNVHGDSMDVLETGSGDIFVNLKDVIRTGFKIYRGNTFIPSMVDRKQIIKEFEMHMLTAAHNFLLTRQNKDVDELKVIQTIENCKKKLLGNNSNFKESAGNSALHQMSNNPVRKQPRENQFHNKNDSFAPENCLQKTDKNFRHKGYKNSQEDLRLPYKNKAVASASSFTSSVDSQESVLIRMLAGENVPFIDLEVGEVCRMKVCYIVPNKQNVCWAHLQSAIPQLEEMMVNIFEAEPELEVLSDPQEGQLVLGLFEGTWCRGKITNVNPIIVHYLDYGNRSRSEVVKLLPESFKETPAFAIRLKLSKFPDGELKDDMTLTVVIKKKYEDRTHIAEVVDDDNDIEANHFVGGQEKGSFKDKEEFFDEKSEDDFCHSEDGKREFFGLPKPLINLRDGTEVKLVDMQDGIIFAKTKECYEKIKELKSYINELDTATLSAVKTNQLVLSRMDSLPDDLHRAIITNIVSNEIVTVKYLDHPGTDNVSVKSLRNVDEYLAKQPVNLLQLPQLDGLQNLGVESMDLMRGMIEGKRRVTLVNHNGKFDLKVSTGQLLSDLLGNCIKNGS